MKLRLAKTMHALAIFLVIGLLTVPIVADSDSSPGYFGGLEFWGDGSGFHFPSPCADLTCNPGDTCLCRKGSVSGTTLVANVFAAGRLTYELSVDESVNLDDGSRTGDCAPASGRGVVTLNDNSTIDFAMSGLECTALGTLPFEQFSGQFNGTVRLDGGTSHDGRLRGLGGISISQQYPSNRSAVRLTSFGIGLESVAVAGGPEDSAPSGGVAPGADDHARCSPPGLNLTGFGSSTDTREPCGDLACNPGDTCDCRTGSIRALAQENYQAVSAIDNLAYELSVNEAVKLDNGTNTGACMPATGHGVLTRKDKSTLDFVMSGLNCTVPGTEPHGLFNGTMQLGGGTFDHGELRGLGSIEIGDVGGGASEVHLTSFDQIPGSVAAGNSQGFESAGWIRYCPAHGAPNNVFGDGGRDEDGFAHFRQHPLDFLGFGSSTDTREPCGDLACNPGDTCDCTSGSIKPLAQENYQAVLAIDDLAYELSVDETVKLDNGTDTGACLPATGHGVLTLKDKSTLDFVMSGLDCTVPGTNTHALFNGTMRLDGGTFHHGKLRGLGSIEIGNIGGATTEVQVTVAVDASGGFQ